MQDKTVTDNKLVKAFRNTPDRAWPTAGKEVARHNADPFKCSFCQNRGIKSFPTMYGLGTTTAKHTKGLFIQTGWARTIRQSEVAKLCAPPRKRKYWLAGLLFFLMMLGLLGSTFISQYLLANLFLYALVTGILGFALFVRSFWWNQKHHPRLMQEWTRMFYCPRCGSIQII
jgi:hypothetical protein